MTSSKKNYTIFDHTADIGIEVRAKDFPTLLKHAAEALFCVMTDISRIRPKNHSQIELYVDKKEEFVRNWLEELLYRFNCSNMIYSKFEINVSKNNHLVADIWGEVFDEERHLFFTEIKGITYHKFEVTQTKDGWFSRVIFDV